MARSDPVLVTVAPAGYLEVAELDVVPWQELADRHAWLLNAIGSAGPGPDVRLPGVRAAALALVAVLAELDIRARAYQAAADHHYRCSCGYSCRGMACFDLHLDQYPPDDPASDQHQEVPDEVLDQTAEEYSAAWVAQAAQDSGG